MYPMVSILSPAAVIIALLMYRNRVRSTTVLIFLHREPDSIYDDPFGAYIHIRFRGLELLHLLELPAHLLFDLRCRESIQHPVVVSCVEGPVRREHRG